MPLGDEGLQAFSMVPIAPITLLTCSLSFPPLLLSTCSYLSGASEYYELDRISALETGKNPNRMKDIWGRDMQWSMPSRMSNILLM